MSRPKSSISILHLGQEKLSELIPLHKEHIDDKGIIPFNFHQANKRPVTLEQQASFNFLVK